MTQERIRYVALSMGAGGLTPQDAATTWARRFGDCKAKTALLIGLLRELGIQGVPVAVSSALGDGMDRRLPMIGQFDHILVRAEVAGRPYFLDGTRSGDVSLAQIEVPMFRWGMEVIPSGGRLIPIIPAPRTIPDDETETVIDASAGFITPAKTRATLTYRGDTAKAILSIWNQLDAEQRDKALKEHMSERFPAVKMASVTATPNAAAAEFRMVAEGTMQLGRKAIQMSGEPDQEVSEDRKPGPFQTAPLALGYPSFNRTVTTLIVPADFPKAGRQTVATVDKVIAGVEHKRSGSWAGDRFTVTETERALVPEISWSEAVAARPAIKAFAEDVVRFRQPADYQPSSKETEQLAKLPAEGTDALLQRAFDLLNNGRPDLSVAASDKLLATSPINADALANRGIAYAWMDKPVEANRDFDAAEKINPDQPVIYRGRGLLALGRSEPRAALKLFQRSLELDPDNLFAVKNVGSIHLSLGDYSAAMTMVERMKALNASEETLHLHRAEILRALGEADKAATELAALADNKQAGVQRARAAQYHSLGRYPEALAALAQSQALKAEPEYYLNRAAHRPLEDREGRKADLQAYRATEPNAPNGTRAMASLLEEQGKYRDAAALYTKAMNKLSDPRVLRLHRGVALIRAGDLAAGRKDIMASLPGKLPAKTLANEHNNSCWALATADVELDLALKQCNEAIRLQPKASSYLDSRGLVYLRQGKLDLALADYDAALESGLFASALMGRSLVHARRGDRGKAETDRRAAERLSAGVAAVYATYGLGLDGQPLANAAN